jgi:serine protease Do
MNPFEGSPFEDFFRRQVPPQEYRSQALGSGVIVGSEGYIITNNHVIAEAEELEVKLFGGEFHDAEVIGTDPNSDLAVIKIDVDGLPSVSYGDPADVRIGQWVMAFGSPLSEDLGNTVTAGIVSGLGRTSFQLSRLNSFSAFIQTDAAINPGNSGGPLVNLRGELIGINSAIYSRSGGYQGVGFAIPVNVVRNVVSQLIDTGTVERGFLGVMFGPISPALAEALDVPRGAAQIEDVTDGSAADEADLREGDIIVAVDGNALRDYNQLRTIIANKLPGEKAELSIVREDARLEKVVTLGRRDEAALAAADRSPSADREDELSGLGITVRDVTQDVLNSLGIEGESISGVVIVNIDSASDAYRDAELRVEDIIVEIDKKKVRSREEFEEAYDAIPDGEAFIVRVIRPGRGSVRSFVTALTKPE